AIAMVGVRALANASTVVVAYNAILIWSRPVSSCLVPSPRGCYFTCVAGYSPARAARQAAPAALNPSGVTCQMKAHVRLVAAMLLLSSPALAQSGKRAFQLADWYQIARVGGGVLSPDGNTLAFTVTTVREAENKR